MMALQPRRQAMLDQPRRAMRALQLAAAAPAHRHRRVAAAVEEHHGLLAGAERFAERGFERGRNPAPGRRRRAPQIDDGDRGQRGAAVPARQHGVAIASARGIGDGFERRGRRSEHRRDRAEMGADHGHVARLIDDALVLLERSVVLLVDDDEAELGERQEQRRARADDDADQAFGDAAPDRAPLGAAHFGMPQRRRAAEAATEALDPLRRQRDFGQQDQRLRAGAQRFGDRLEIDFGLARAGDAFEQGDAEAAVAHRAAQTIGGARLIGRECHRRRVGIGEHARRRLGPRLGGKRARFDQALDDRGADVRLARQRGGGERFAFAERVERALPRRARRLGRGVAGDFAQHGGGGVRLEGFGNAHRHAQDRARRRQSVVRHPVDEAALHLGHRRDRQARGDRLHLRRRDRAAAGAPHDANGLAPAERHAHEIARRHGERRRNRVIVGARQRQGQ